MEGKIVISLCLIVFICNQCSPMHMKDLLDQFSWRLKLKILKDMQPGDMAKKSTPTPLEIPTLPSDTALLPSPVFEAPPEVPAQRRVGIESLKMADKRDSKTETLEKDYDNDMRLKLFRLMYETVRDSDLKAKRAELIKDHYTNSTVFEIGYLMGDITDKSNVMNDIALTLKRFHKEWMPIEHINAYEQIANQAIEINHLIDLIRLVNKKESDNRRF